MSKETAGDIVLTAVWTLGEYKSVSFDAMGGSPVPDTQSVFSGRMIIDPNFDLTPGADGIRKQTPQKEGYVFSEWGLYDAQNYFTVWNFNKDTVASDMTLYATYQPLKTTVNFHINNGGDSNINKTFDYGTTAVITAPTPPDGYVFGGYYTKADGGVMLFDIDGNFTGDVWNIDARYPGVLDLDATIVNSEILGIIYGVSVTMELYAQYEKIEITAFAITNDEVKISEKGGTAQLNLLITPSYVSQAATWSSSDDGIATVDENGLVTAVENGTGYVTATSTFDIDFSATAAVYVSGQETLAENIVITSEGGVSAISEVNGTLQLYANVLPEDTSDKTVVWIVSPETDYATIDQNGLLTAQRDGTAEVIARTADGSGVYGTFYVTITGHLYIGPPAMNAGIDPWDAVFDKNPDGENHADIAVTLFTHESVKLYGILNDYYPLIEGTGEVEYSDYTVSVSEGGDNIYTLKKEYLTTLEPGNYSITFVMSKWTNPVLELIVEDTSEQLPTYSITLTQVEGGAATVSHTSAAAGDSVGLGISSLVTGYKFVRWDTSPAVTWTSGSESTASASFTMPDEDITVTPVYEYDPSYTYYTVIYDGNGSNRGTAPVDSNSPYESGSNVTVLSNTGNLAKTGCTFGGWNTQADGGGTDFAAGDVFEILTNTVLYAKWIVDDIPTKYDVELIQATGGAATISHTSAAAGDIVELGISSLDTGYKFIGWNISPAVTWVSGNESTASASFIMPDEDITVTPEYEYDPSYIYYSVTYDGNNETDGIAPVDGNSPYESGSNVTVLGNIGNLTKTGYAFGGWNTQADGGGTDFAANDVFEIVSNVVLYAKWITNDTPIEHSVGLMQSPGGIATVSRANATAGTAVSVSINSFDADYMFLRWDISPEVEWKNGSAFSENASFYMPDYDVTILPVFMYKWEYEITENFTEIRITKYLGHDAIVVVPEKIGGITVTGIAAGAFAGISGIVSVILPAGITSIGAGALAAIGLSSVEFLAPAAGVAVLTLGVGIFGSFLSSIIKIIVPKGAREAYAEKLSDQVDDVDNQIEEKQDPEDDDKTYNVTVKTVDGGIAAAAPSIGVLAGTSVKLTANPRDGYTFVRWDVSPQVKWAGGGQNSENASFIMPNSNVAVTPVYKEDAEKTYNITLVNTENGDPIVSHTRAEEGAIIKLTAEPKKGYTFTKWDVSPSVTWASGGENSENASFIMPNSDVSVKPEYEKDDNAHTITLKQAKGGTAAVSRTSATEGETIELSILSLEKDYTFKQWNISPEVALNNSGAINKSVTFTMPDEDVTITPEYEYQQQVYTVTIDGGEGARGEGEYNENDIVIITAGDPPDGEKFKEWEMSPDITFLEINISDIDYMDDISLAIFFMPAENVEAKAVFEEEDDEPEEFDIILKQSTGGTATVSHESAEAGTIIELQVTELLENYSFVRWVMPSAKYVEWTDGDATSETASFTMPNRNVTIVPQYRLEEQKTCPTGIITVNNFDFTSFVDSITFGLFLKGAQDVTITAVDGGGETAEIEYFVADFAMTESDLLLVAWAAYEGAFSIQPGKRIIYAKFSDASGNSAIISTDGIVIFNDSAASASGSYTKGAGSDLIIEVAMNGNTVKEIAKTDGTIMGADYTAYIDKIVFDYTYLETLANGSHEFIVSYYPQGVTKTPVNESEAVGTTTITINILPAQGKIIYVGTQNGVLTQGAIGNATFAVATANIASGQDITLNNTDGVAGITMDTVTTVGNSTVITIRTTADTPEGTHKLSVTIDGADSNIFDLVVDAPAQPQGYTLYVCANAGGTVSGDANGLYAEGEEISVTAVANSDYHFVSWSVTGVTLSDNTTSLAVFNMPANAVTLTASFEPDAPTVTGVTVSPSAADVQKGGQRQFGASVDGTNNPATTVTWDVSGSNNAGTFIFSDGLLTVALDEEADELTVTAVSTADTDIYDTATVTVTDDVPEDAYGISLDISGTHIFLSATENYGDQAAHTLTVNITNTGNQATGELTVSLTDDDDAFSIVSVFINDIAVGGNSSFTITPITGLEPGTYIATVTVSGDNGISA